MHNSIAKVPNWGNEKILEYKPNTPETEELQNQLARLSSEELDIPILINGKEVRTGQTQTIHPPHHTRMTLGKFHLAGPEELQAAVQGSLTAWKDWSQTSGQTRASIFLKAAELLSTKYRSLLNAATMLGQSKTCHQAEIDAACELIDFFRFNAQYQQQLYLIQPESNQGTWNQMQYRPLEGFVLAITPFNFTSIAGNLPTSPALMGNVCLWKPASTSVYSGYFIMKLLQEAGLPPGVIQFIPSSGKIVGELLLTHRNLAGVHFTGSTAVFQNIWKTIGNSIETFKSYPRIVGETGGKDFIFAHPSCNKKALTTAMIRGAFEYQGQKCSAASRAYIPKSLWPSLKEELVGEIKTIRMGDVMEFSNFMGAVIDKNSFERIKSYIDFAKQGPDSSILVGGQCHLETGYFIEPTVIETTNPKFKTMCEEIFGPVLSVYVYEDSKYEDTLRICDDTSSYALTGCIFAQDRAAIETASKTLMHSAGNFYINNKPTGAVVNQQPFGGGRASGTNDKAGSVFNLLRWVSIRTVSETLAPPINYRYPFMNLD